MQNRCGSVSSATRAPWYAPICRQMVGRQAGHKAVSSHSLHLSAHGENIKDMAASSDPPDALERVLLIKVLKLPHP